MFTAFLDELNPPANNISQRHTHPQFIKKSRIKNH